MLWSAVAGAALPVEIADAVATGDCATVLASAEPATDEARLAHGWCLAQSDPAAAAALLDGVTSGVIGDYARWTRAEALVAAGEPEAALAVLDGLTLPGRAGLEVRLARGRALIELERSLDARTDLRALLDTEVSVQARYWLAVGGEQRGATDAAIATYAIAWRDGVRGPWSARAAERLEALGAPVPDASTPEGRELVRGRAAALAADHQHPGALALLELLAEEVPETATGLELARQRFKARDYAGAATAYREALGEPSAASGPADDLFDYALGTSRTGDYDTAAVIYARLTELHPTTRSADFASFKLGYLEYDRGNCDEARARFQTHIDARPASDHLDEALWFQGRCAWRSGDIEAARDAWDALVDARPRSSLVPGALYWKARALGREGHAEAEQESLWSVLRKYPVSGYAYFAAERLGHRFPTRSAASRPAWPEAFAARDDVQRAEALLGVGLRAHALAELDPVAAAASAAGRDAAVAAAHAFIAAGDYRRGQELASPYCGRPWERKDPVAQQACTPRPEASIVARVAATYDLPPLLPYGIMVAESALQPDVTSVAGARGLMQVMPAEAPRMHEALFGTRDMDPDDLYAGPYAAAMGTTELGLKHRALGGLLDGGDVVAVVASYNGGEQAVRRWRAMYDEPPPFDEYAEDIGYTETRRYVKRVLGYVMAYRWVYGDPE